MEYRIEHDSMGEMKVPADRYWAAQTQRSCENFPIGVGIETMPREITYAFGLLKQAAARANHALKPGKMILMGHSAGGNLCIGAVMRSLQEKMPLPALLVCEYPPLDIYTDPGEKKHMGKGVPAERARLYNLYYCDRELQRDPYCSPTYAPDEMLVGFPPTLMITGACDDLCNEAEDFALRLARCGCEVTLKRVPGAGHAFTIYRREGHEAAFELMVRYLRRSLVLK